MCCGVFLGFGLVDFAKYRGAIKFYSANKRFCKWYRNDDVFL